MELTREQLDALYDLTVVSDDGHTLGPVGHIYLDDYTQQATWITAKTGLFGLRQVFIPFQGARIEPDTIKVRFTKDYILDAPRFDTDGHITEAEQDELFGYFRVRRPGTAPGPEPAAEQPQPPPQQHDPAAPPGPPPPGTPTTEVPDQAAVHPEQVVAETEEVASHGALVDPVADDDPLVEEPAPERNEDPGQAHEDEAEPVVASHSGHDEAGDDEPGGNEPDDDEPDDDEPGVDVEAGATTADLTADEEPPADPAGHEAPAEDPGEEETDAEDAAANATERDDGDDGTPAEPRDETSDESA